MKNRNNEKIDFKYNIGIYLNLLKKYWLPLGVVLFLVLVLEGIGVGEKYLFKIIIDQGTSFAEKSLEYSVFVHTLIFIAIAFGAMLVGKSITRFAYIHLLSLTESRLISDLKKKFFNHLITLDHTFHVSHKTGSLISRLSRGGSAIERMTDTIVFNFAPLFFQVIVAGISLWYFSWVPLVIILVTMVVFVSFGLYLQHIQQDAMVKATRAEDLEKGVIADIFTNIDSIKYFGKDSAIQKRYGKISDTTREIVMRNWNYGRWNDSIQALILGIGALAIVYFSLREFLAGRMTLGTVAFIYTIYGSLLSSVNNFVRGMRDFYRVMADFDALFQYNKIEKDVKDKENAKDLVIKEGSIDFNDISFKYHSRKIFDHFTLKIKKNEKIALVGHSGSGKTTLIKLLYRLYDVESGSILIDGKEVREFTQESVRGEMSIVPQECILFDDSIYNNIAFSNPKASRAEVLRAIKFAQLDKIIKTFPHKEDTIVGERGIKLSGGEKQRVSIARALLANKKILVLDEATSSLDSETEYEIKKDLDRLMQGRTSIIIAHRLSTIMKADRIIVMKAGKIVQMGKHNQLIDQPGEYKKLWGLQKGGYIGE